VTSGESRTLACADCGDGIEACAFCDEPECARSLCNECLQVALGERIPETQERHGRPRAGGRG
jgi:hypothetical protein